MANGARLEQQPLCLLKLDYEVSFIEPMMGIQGGLKRCVCVCDESSSLFLYTCLCEWGGGEEKNGVCLGTQESVFLMTKHICHDWS